MLPLALSMPASPNDEADHLKFAAIILNQGNRQNWVSSHAAQSSNINTMSLPIKNASTDATLSYLYTSLLTSSA
jgi:hypothetical protein